VEFWGIAGSETEKNASRIAAENIAGVRAVVDRRSVISSMPAYI